MEIKSKRLYERGGVLYIDARTIYGRVRVSTGARVKEKSKIMDRLDEIIFSHLRYEGARSIEFNFKELSREFFSSLNSQKEITLRAYKTMINKIISFFGTKDIRLISLSHYKNFLDGKNKNIFFMLNRLLQIAKHNGANVELLESKYFNFSVKVRENNEIFSLEEVKKILDAARGELKIFLAISFLSGARSGEVLALNKSDFNLIDKTININKTIHHGKITSPKTKSSIRKITLLKPLEDIITPYLQSLEREELFNFSIDYIRRRFYKLLRDLGLKVRLMYNTRHSFTSIMMKNGEEPLWISNMLGHKNLNITYQVYTKYIPDKKSRALFLEGVL